MQEFELDSTKPPALVWWRADHADGWLSLDHSCGGHSHNRLSGWVRPITVPHATVGLLLALDSEEFAIECYPGGLAYKVTEEHRVAFARFLQARGLLAGDVLLLQQAVYPLDPCSATLEALGIDGEVEQPGASLLVLGWNVD